MLDSLIIGVTTRITSATNYIEQRDSISHDMLEYIKMLGGIPLLLPNVCEKRSELIKICDLIILSGGDDITHLPNGTLLERTVKKNIRDKVEYSVLDTCLSEKKPVMAICRGMQLVNLWFGGSLKIVDEELHVNKKHSVKILNNEFSDLLNTKRKNMVNSYHRYAIFKETLGKNLIPGIVASDNSIEAFVDINRKFFGVMWHPERDDGKFSINFNVINKLLNIRSIK